MDYSIPFEYMKIERAANYFNCEIDDFFFWHKAGLIKLCIDCDDYRASLLSINGHRMELPPEICMECDQIHHSNDYRDELSAFVNERLVVDKLAMVARSHGTATGFFVPNDYVIDLLKSKNSELLESFSATPYMANSDYRVFIDVRPFPDFSDPFIDKFSLVIVNQDLINIKNLLNPDKTKKTGSNKTINAMAKLIKQLLVANYGEEVAGNPRKHLDGKDGIIKRQFESKGLPTPEGKGKAVSEWLKNIDIDD